MEYEFKRATNVQEAADIIDGAVRVLYQQIEFNSGVRKRSWNGDFVVHLKREAEAAVEFLRQSAARDQYQGGEGEV